MTDWWSKFSPQPQPKPLDLSFLDKFAPPIAPPQAPQTVPITPPKGASAPVQLYQAILAYNNGLAYFKTGATSWTESAEGVTIHKISETDAVAISARVKVAAIGYDLKGWSDLQKACYCLGCLAVESTLDPNCENANIGVNSLGQARSNPTNDPLGYDVGVAQLKLRYLVGVAPGCTDADSARAFALDVNRAIPYHASIMAGNILWAENVIAQDTSSAPDPRMKNPALLGTAAYNFGRTGVMTYFENGTFPHHCQMVSDMTGYFCEAIGQPSPFAS